MEATGVDLADQFSERIAATYAKLDNGAQRMAIGMRWSVRYGQEDQVWGRAVARISDTATAMKSLLANYVRTDLHLGKKQQHRTYDDEKVAPDLILGTVLAAVRTAEEPFIGSHPEKCAAMILHALEFSPRRSKRFAHMALPYLNEPPGTVKFCIGGQQQALLRPKARVTAVAEVH
jgi:hypothetical protein